MPNYKNNSSSVKTFYGVEFKPGEVHYVPGYINAKGINRVSDVLPQKQSEDIVEVKESIISEDLTPEPEIEVKPEIIKETSKVSKKGKGRKSKRIYESIEETISEEPILSENIEEGEEN